MPRDNEGILGWVYGVFVPSRHSDVPALTNGEMLESQRRVGDMEAQVPSNLHAECERRFAANAEALRIERKKNSKYSANSQLVKENHQFSGENVRLEGENVQLKEKIVQLEEKIGQLSADNAALRNTVRTAQEEPAEQQNQDAELRRRAVMLGLASKKLDDKTAENDRLKAIIEQGDRTALFRDGLNIQATFPNLVKIKRSIAIAMYGPVREYVYNVSRIPVPAPELLAHVFRGCQALVTFIHATHKAFFLGATTPESAPTESMDERVKAFMLQHMRRHYKTLYRLTGRDLDWACGKVIFHVAEVLYHSSPKSHFDEALQVLNATTEIREVIKAYLPILVSVTLHPGVLFGNDCGVANEFSKKIHENSIDGDAVRRGDECIVVFPALSSKLETGEGYEAVSKKYILPKKDPSGAATATRETEY